MKEVIELVPKAGAAISTAAITISVAYEYGYFFLIDIRFLSAASVSDYLVRALDWLPLIVTFPVTMFASYKVAVFFTPERGNAGEVSAAVVGLAAVIALFVAAIVQSGEKGFGLFILTIAIPQIMLIMVGVIGDKALKPVLLMLVPSLLISFFFLGWLRANHDLLAGPNYEFEMIRDGGGASPQKVRLLRIYEKGLLMKRPNEGNIEFVVWSELRALRQLRPSPTQ